VPGAVPFDIAPLKSENGSLRFQSTYSAQGKIAKFVIEFGPGRKLEGKDLGGFVPKTGEGRFVTQPESDPSVLLVELQKALEARAIPRKTLRVAALPFTFVDIGDNLSQAPNGGFNVKPAGGWIAIKIFIGEGEQEGQVFVNLNPTIGKGQFSIKDADYGDIVLKELAAVL